MQSVEVHQLELERSSVINSLAYDSSDCSVYVEFKRNGDVWRYEGVGRTAFDALLEARSIGSEFSRSIKQWYTGSRVEDGAWAAIVIAGQRLSSEQRRAAYEKANKALFEQLRRSPKAITF